MKKLLSVILIFVLSSSLFACSKNPSETEPTAPDRDFKVTMKVHIYRCSFGYYPAPDWTEDFEFEDLREGDQISWEQLNLLILRGIDPAVEIVSIDDDNITITTNKGTEVLSYGETQKVFEGDQFYLADESYVTFTKETA